MSLFGKSPVDKPCEADSFEEAFRKNRARIAHEKDQAQSLYEGMLKDGDPQAESVNPVFWQGMLEGNAKACLIYEDEMKAARQRMVDRLKAAFIPPASPSKVFSSGWEAAVESWSKALENNDPSVIVYW